MTVKGYHFLILLDCFHWSVICLYLFGHQIHIIYDYSSKISHVKVYESTLKISISRYLVENIVTFDFVHISQPDTGVKGFESAVMNCGSRETSENWLQLTGYNHDWQSAGVMRSEGQRVAEQQAGTALPPPSTDSALPMLLYSSNPPWQSSEVKLSPVYNLKSWVIWCICESLRKDVEDGRPDTHATTEEMWYAVEIRYHALSN